MLADWLLRLFTLKSRRFNVAPRVARLSAIVLSAASIDLIACNGLEPASSEPTANVGKLPASMAEKAPEIVSPFYRQHQ